MCPHLFVICSSYTLWLPIFFQWLIIHYYAWLFWCTNPFGFIHWKPRARLSCGLATWSPWTSTGTQAIAQTGCLVQEFHLMGGKSPRTETFKSISWQWTTNREKKKERKLTHRNGWHQNGCRSLHRSSFRVWKLYTFLSFCDSSAL